MKFYKIRHIETGMFYQPVKGRFSSTKTNLSKNGKIYNNKPSLKHIDHGYNMLIKNPDKPLSKRKISKFFRFKKEDWEIVEFEVIEVGATGHNS